MGWLRFITTPPSVPKGVETPKVESTVGVQYDTAWARTRPAKLAREVGVYGFMKPAIRLYGSPRVVGADRLKNVIGPLVFAANHHSHADTSLLLATIPGHLRRNLAVAAGADYFFPNRLTSALSALFIGAIPIERKKLSKLSIENAMEALTDGNSLLIYPEGGRSPDGWSSEHRPGAAFVAKKADVPVVPVYIDGTGSILPKGKNWPTRSRCAVVFGKPLRSLENEDAREFAKRIETTVNELAEEFSSGWWQARKKAHAGTVDELTGPETAAWRRRWALGPARTRQNTAAQRSWPK
ncbi:MAG: 1-acyl-sn-glycerol-3-phosphate acyltransferase [Acidimicrobiales bacterium]|nr:1-acyl-sn-glycerol-3-phosphate acyltransferase [Acidimicrobiales bacterium]